MYPVVAGYILQTLSFTFFTLNRREEKINIKEIKTSPCPKDVFIILPSRSEGIILITGTWNPWMKFFRCAYSDSKINIKLFILPFIFPFKTPVKINNYSRIWIFFLRNPNPFPILAQKDLKPIHFIPIQKLVACLGDDIPAIRFGNQGDRPGVAFRYPSICQIFFQSSRLFLFSAPSCLIGSREREFFLSGSKLTTSKRSAFFLLPCVSAHFFLGDGLRN